jgi:hypothetical protein
MQTKIRKRLKLNVVKFAYKKKNGDIRYATGTNNVMLLNEMYGLNIKENDSIDRGDLINYYDLEKQGWRCFNKQLLTKIY